MKTKIKTHTMVICTLFSALIAIGAFIKIPIPVVPFTLQFLFTTLAGMILGGKKGALSVGIYIFIGLVGIPVFASGGGIGYFIKPTFGYIIGFLIGTYYTGKMVERLELTYKNLLIAGFVGLAIVYIIGMTYYFIVANFFISSPIGIWSLILYCFILAVPGDIFIIFICAYIGKRVIPVIGGKI
ncbi:MAG: biotin transporter BioY [Clostridium sp.]